jgi:hypothetical protein
LNVAKINALDAIRRERVPGSPDDLSGPATDYVDRQSTTNEFAVISPYEITFRCFTPELAGVLAGFAQSRYGLVVKAINAEPSLLTDASPTSPNYYFQPTIQPSQRYGEEGVPAGGDRYANRYGNRYGAPPPVVQPQPVAVATAGKPGLQTFLKEKQLKVTLLVHVVKLLPPQK